MASYNHLWNRKNYYNYTNFYYIADVELLKLGVLHKFDVFVREYNNTLTLYKTI